MSSLRKRNREFCFEQRDYAAHLVIKFVEAVVMYLVDTMLDAIESSFYSIKTLVDLVKTLVDCIKTFIDSLELFIDRFAGNFGHCTGAGNRLLAENLAEVISKKLGTVP